MSKTDVPSRCFLLLLAALLPLVGGCRESAPEKRPASSPDTPAATGTSSQRPQRDHFEIALESLRQRDEFNLERAARQVIYHLNCWIENQPADPRWFADLRMIKTLPLETRTAPNFDNMVSERSLALLEFRPSDVAFLEETRWLKSISRWAAQQPDDEQLAAWLAAAELPGDTSEQLATCYKLFDWTVRNLQLDLLLPYPRKTTAGPAASPNADDPAGDWPPPLRAVPGPGYQYFPWHVLQYGHADALQRARVFILLCRQIGLEAVMLGIDTKSGRPTSWLPAVLIDDQLYLFDTQLGLPVPTKSGQGIATLAQVINDVSILRSLDVGDKYKYPIAEKDLQEVVAMLDTSPEYLSQRMKVLESNLAAEWQMVLTTSPTAAKRQLESCEGLKEIRLWAIPYETAMYRGSYQVLLQQDAEASSEEFSRHGVFNLGLTELAKGRRKHLLGQFASTDAGKGAIEWYLASRMANSSLENLGSSEKARLQLGIKRQKGMSQYQWETLLRREKEMRVRAKQNASYFLGLIHFQKGNYDVATKWFTTRTLDAYPDGPWIAGARYNLARCQEALGDVDEARRLYLTDESPQRHGSLIRARRLESTEEPAS
jgi:hypothetical protein